MSALRGFAYAGRPPFGGGTLADRLNIDTSDKSSTEIEVEVNRALLRLFGVRFVGGAFDPLSGSWNGSRSKGYTLGDIGQILQRAGVDITSEDLVQNKFPYRVLRGADFTYIFKQCEGQDGQKRYRLVRDALVWT